MTEIHITNPTPIKEDLVMEKSLRPSFFGDFIGQNDIVSNLKLYIEAANQRNES